MIASDGDLRGGDLRRGVARWPATCGSGRLISFYDQNHISIEGDTSLAFSEDVGKRYEAYGWHVQDLEEDIALDRLEQALRDAMAVEDKPSLIIVRTHIAQGSPNKHDTAGAHGSPLGEEEVKLTKEAMGWPSQEPFYVPEEALAHFRGQYGRARRRAARPSGTSATTPTPRRIRSWPSTSSAWCAASCRAGWDAEVPRFHASGTMTATRKSSQTVIQWAAAQVPEFVGGSADLAPSTLTLVDDADSVEPGDYGGRNLHFGIREHAMGAIVNGLNLHYLRAFGATFFTFSDYMRGSVRLAALMKLPVDLRLHARLDRPGGGRPDPPADRAPGGPAGDADAVGRPSRRRQRDRAGVALCDRHEGQPDRAGPVAPGRPDVEPVGDPRRRDRARGLRAARSPTRSPSPT